MSLALWIGLGILVWIAVAVAVAVLVGRIIRQRDRQIPDDGPDAPEPGSAEPASPSGHGRRRQGGGPHG